METTQLLQAFRGRLARLPLTRHPAFFFSPGLEGYRTYTFGGRAGPSVHISHVLHEMAHAAQFGPDEFRSRSLDSGFRFKMPQQWIANHFICEPSTDQATQREISTFGMQLHLTRAVGMRISDAVFAHTTAGFLRHMPDSWNVPGENDEDRQRTCAQQILQAYEATTEAEVIDRLEGWLDETKRRVRRLARKAKHRGAEFPENCHFPRYRMTD